MIGTNYKSDDQDLMIQRICMIDSFEFPIVTMNQIMNSSDNQVMV